MTKNKSLPRISSNSSVRQLLLGSELQATLVLEKCGADARQIENLVQASKSPKFESGVFSRSSQKARLIRKLYFFAAEMFFQMHRLKKALAGGKWAAATEAAWLLGEARGSLFCLTTEHRLSSKGLSGTIRTKHRKIKQILDAATRFYQEEVERTGDRSVKGEYLWGMVHAEMDADRLPRCSRSTFFGHWKLRRSELQRI